MALQGACGAVAGAAGVSAVLTSCVLSAIRTLGVTLPNWCWRPLRAGVRGAKGQCVAHETAFRNHDTARRGTI